MSFSDFNIQFKEDEHRCTKELILHYKKGDEIREISSGEYDISDVGSFTSEEICEFFEITGLFNQKILKAWFKDFFNNLAPITGDKIYDNIIYLTNWYGYFVVMDIGDIDFSQDKPSIFYLIDSEVLMSLLNDDMKCVLRAFREVLKKKGIHND